MTHSTKHLRRNGALSLSSLLVMAALFGVLSLVAGGFSRVPLLVVFILTSVYSLLTLRGLRLGERVAVFSRGAGDENLLLMVWIFVLAGAFAAVAKALGAVDATVALSLRLLPAELLLPGVFLAACFISLSIGTSVGTIVALVPIAAGLAGPSGLSVATLVAATVGGAFLGDNLSFISDTTVAATRTQGCRMRDKFRANFRIALPAALAALALYAFLGRGTQAPPHGAAPDLLLVVPYLFVLCAALLGMNVLLVLLLGTLVACLIGLGRGVLTAAGCLDAICAGIGGMGELILVSMMAGGLLAVIRKGGGITWLLRRLTQHVHTARGGQLAIALLVSLTNLCTANNTVAILSTGPLARDIALRFHIAPRRSASLLDTFSCVVQGMLPYGAQLLMAGGLCHLSPTSLVPRLYYPMLLAASALIYIAISGRTPRTASTVPTVP